MTPKLLLKTAGWKGALLTINKGHFEAVSLEYFDFPFQHKPWKTILMVIYCGPL